MKRTTLYCMMFLGAALAGNAEAIYKCTTAKGVVYQDRPCREGAESDVQIVIPTGEIAPKDVAAQEDGLAANANVPKAENRFGGPRTGRPAADDSATVTRPAERKTKQANTKSGDEAQKKDAAAKSGTPMTADQAQKAEATAKYFTTDAAAPGFEVPQQMTCESPSGEKRIFILTNGKLTSI
jgi:hypothetical protein